MHKSRVGKIVCAHYISRYLPITENWIFKILSNLEESEPIMLTRNVENLDQFPVKNIFSLGSLNLLLYYYNIGIYKFKGYLPAFKYYCNSLKANILHIHFGYNGIKSIGLKRELKIPIVCSFYGNDVFRWPHKEGFMPKFKYMFKEVDKILALGPYMKNELIKIGCPENKIEIQHLGVDINKIKFVQKKAPIDSKISFLIASSFVQKKGIQVAINALGLIANKFDFTVDIIGDGPLKEDIITCIRNNNLVDHVQLHGYQSYQKIINFAYNSHMFLQASKTASDNDKEGTPMVIADVMATGLPVISTNHSDIPEIVIDGFNGYLAEENSIEDFAKAILRFVREQEKLEEFSHNARLHIEQNFNSKIQAKRLETIYSNLVN